MEKQFSDIEKGFNKVLSFNDLNSPNSSKLKSTEIDESDKENSHQKKKLIKSDKVDYFKSPTYNTSGQAKFTFK